ncbi:hypothetical protein QL898_13570 [Psychrobacter sp. APC 3279]|uniref:hypothetical protein n=1 Tax=Psychrobacter sp. APC 3279 TaxID=3035189 RepID=UPI0025B43C4C|nr:hypothetical protein [Psychrobacter sp. APC 3279]MDN3442656.1 hypothetical protein [Psychrobacter sp. APC 3279]
MTLSIAISSALFMSSCATTTPAPAPPEPKLATAPKYAVLFTDNVRIEAVGLNWKMTPNTPTTPPKFYDATLIGDGNLDTPGTVFPTSIYDGDYESLPYFMKDKAIDVLIHVNARKKPLYGKIIFMTVRDSTPDVSAKRMWSVAIPSEYIRIADSGSMSVVYQPYKYSNSRNLDIASWVLHMSALPF